MARPRKTVDTEETPKRRGRPPKNAVEKSVSAEPVKRRGRPPVKKTEEAPVAKRRGRPPKAEKVTAVEAAPKRRGRPPKNADAPAKTNGASKSNGHIHAAVSLNSSYLMGWLNSAGFQVDNFNEAKSDMKNQVKKAAGEEGIKVSFDVKNDAKFGNRPFSIDVSGEAPRKRIKEVHTKMMETILQSFPRSV